MTDTATRPAERVPPPETLRAVPVRHPGRWVAAAVIALLLAMFAHMLVTNRAFQWRFMFDNMFRPPVIEGVRTALVVTILAMIIGVALGTVIAVMRLSPNPVLSTAAWVYTWFFRAVPRIVLLVLFGNLGILYARYEFGLPFDRQIGNLFGIDFSARVFGVDARTVVAGSVTDLLGLALSEAAYMAEIVRAGIQSVDPGQQEAAQACGMGRGVTLRRIVLPQAMRVIVPPTGNETIAMLKDTALLAFVPVTNELFFQLQAIGARTFRVFPMLVAACLWYLAMTSVLMVGQFFLERYFSRGFGTGGRRGVLGMATDPSGVAATGLGDERVMVKAEGVHKRFGRLEVLKGIDLEVKPREVTVMLGPSGSGKSTFLRCINHLEKINAGRLWVDGELVGYRQHGDKLYELKEGEVARKRAEIGMVFQRFNLFPHMTALGNVIEAPMRVKGVRKADAVSRGHELLGQVGLADKADVYPAQLSGGQQQRVAIARALAGDVLDGVRKLVENGMTMIVVTHEMGFAREVGSHLVFMDQGVVVEEGRPTEVFANPRHHRTKAFLSRIL